MSLYIRAFIPSAGSPQWAQVLSSGDYPPFFGHHFSQTLKSILSTAFVNLSIFFPFEIQLNAQLENLYFYVLRIQQGFSPILNFRKTKCKCNALLV